MFCPKQTPGGFGHPALSAGESANQQSAIARIKKPQRECERLMDLTKVFIFLIHWLEVPLLNAWTALQFARSWESSKGMRSAREDFHSFDCIPAPICLGSREAPVQGSHRLVQSARRSVGRSQDVIKKLVSDCILTRQAQILEDPQKVWIRFSCVVCSDSIGILLDKRAPQDRGERAVAIVTFHSTMQVQELRATSDCPT